MSISNLKVKCVIKIKKLIESYCVDLQCLTKILCTLTSNLITIEIELRQCLFEKRKTNIIEMMRRIQSCCVVLESLTEILYASISDLISSEVE